MSGVPKTGWRSVRTTTTRPCSSRPQKIGGGIAWPTISTERRMCSSRSAAGRKHLVAALAGHRAGGRRRGAGRVIRRRRGGETVSGTMLAIVSLCESATSPGRSRSSTPWAASGTAPASAPAPGWRSRVASASWARASSPAPAGRAQPALPLRGAHPHTPARRRRRLRLLPREKSPCSFWAGVVIITVRASCSWR